MSIPPPPIYTDDGAIVPLPENIRDRFDRLRRYKRNAVVYIEDERDTYNFPSDTSRFALLLRCMPNSADLRIILAAARHLELISSCRVVNDVRTELPPEFEKAFTVVYYEIGTRAMAIDPDFTLSEHHLLDYHRRRQIWEGLFAAAGYKTSWGCALNIRHPK